MHFEDRLILLQKRVETAPSLSLFEIMGILSGKGRTLLLILLSLPFCQPIQIPGMSTPFGLMIAFIGFRMSFGKNAWLPKKVMSKQISASTIKKMAQHALWLIKKMGRWIHPRLSWFIQKKVNGYVIVVLGLFLALPLPIPFSNLLAAWSILWISLGILGEDGLFVILGYVFGLITFLIIIFIIWGIIYGIR